jgi:ABC-2 type transport system permease protein
MSNIVRKDIKILFKDRGQVISLFLLPMVFILAFSIMGGGVVEEQTFTLPVVNPDPDGETTQALIETLDLSGKVQIRLYDQEEALALLDDGEIERVLTIPANLTADIAAGRPVTLRLVSDPDADETATQAIQATVESAAQGVSLQSQLIARFEELDDSAPMDEMVAQAQSQFERAASAPLVTMHKTWPENLLGKDDLKPVQLYAPGFTILFVFLAAQATAQSIYEEKKLGSFRRLLAAPINKMSILIGKMLPNFIIVLTQVVVIFGLSMFVYPLLGLDPMTLGNDPLALVLVSLAVALCSTSLGILIIGFARTESQISGISTVALWVMGVLGGAFFPSFLMGGLGNMGQVTPHYWAIQAYQDLLVRGQGLADVTTEMAVLLGFTLVFFVAGLRRFEFDS